MPDCPHCSEPLPEGDATVCPGCGQPLSSHDDEPPSADASAGLVLDKRTRDWFSWLMAEDAPAARNESEEGTRHPTPGETASEGERASELVDHALWKRIKTMGLDKGPFGPGLSRVKRLVGSDPDMALTKCRQILERCLHDLVIRHVGDPGTQPLERIIQLLGRAKVLPRKLQALAEVIRELGNVGAHPVYDDEHLSHREAQIALSALTLVLEWFVRGL